MLRKIEPSYFVAWLGCLVVMMAMAGGSFLPGIDGMLVGGISGFFCFLLLATVIVPNMRYNNKRQWEEGNRVIESIRSNFLSITEVNHKLQQLADEFTVLCQQQVQFQNAEAAVAETKAIEEKIARAKSRFWAAHSLAVELGYIMRANIGDYASVPKALARRRRQKAA